MNGASKPKTAGILEVIIGILGMGTGLFVELILVEPFFNSDYFIFIRIITTIVGVMAIIGGVYAFKRKRWALAITGAIATIALSVPITWLLIRALSWIPGISGFLLFCSLFVIIIPAIIATSLIIQSREQFKREIGG